MKEKGNSGFTLVELLVSIAISALVLLSVVTLMNFSTRNYRNASKEVSLQTEAQLILNQLMNFIIEANNVKYDETNKKLTIYYEDKTIKILFDETNHQLDFETYDSTGAQIGDKQLLGRYVASFHVVDTGENNSNSQIKISLKLENGTHSYEVKDQILTIRNQLKAVP